MRKIALLIIFCIIALIIVQNASASDIVRLSWKITKDMVEESVDDSVLVVLTDKSINTNSLVLPYMEMICTQGTTIFPLDTGGEDLSNIVISDGEVKLYLHKAPLCDSAPRNLVGLTIILFVVPADRMITKN